jgi:hypothetical protein
MTNKKVVQCSLSAKTVKEGRTMTAVSSSPGPRLAYLLLILGAAVTLHAPHLFSYIGDTNYDFFLHYNWAREFTENLRAGDFYPRWIFHGRYGLGEPVFITYSPIYYYLVALFASAGFDNWVSMQLVAIFCNAAFAWFVYAATAHYVSHRIALIVAIAALLNPFLVMLHYKFHGLAWGATAYLSHGMLLWALIRPAARKNGLNIWAAIAIALAVATHTISALINLVCYSVFCLVRALPAMGKERQAFFQAVLGWALTVALGLLLSAAYLDPALSFMHIMSAEQWVGDYRLEAFAWPIVTMLHGQTQWFSIQWPVSVPALLMFLASGYYYGRFRHRLGAVSSPLLLALSAAAVSIFFASELSYPIWAFPNPISQINLPYRFVSVTYTTAIFAVGLALHHALSEGDRRWASLLMTLLCLSLVTAATALFKGAYLDGKPLGREIEQGDYTFGAAAERFAEEGYLERCAGDASKCIRALRSAGGFSGVPEYELKWARPGYVRYAHEGYLAHCAKVGVSCQKPQRIGSGLDFEVAAEKAAALVLPIFHYPAWRMFSDGQMIASEPDPETGLIRVNIEPGRHHLALRWVPTEIETRGLIESGIGLAILLLYGFVSFMWPRHPSGSER